MEHERSQKASREEKETSREHTWGGEPLDVPVALNVPEVGVAGVEQRSRQPHRLVEAVPLLHRHLRARPNNWEVALIIFTAEIEGLNTLMNTYIPLIRKDALRNITSPVQAI